MKKEINVVAKYMVDLFNSNVKCCRIKCLKADNLSIYLTHNWQLLTMQYLLRIAHNAHCAMAGASGSCPYNMYDMVSAGPSCEECRQTRPRSASVWAPVERAGWRTLWRIGGELVLLPHSAMTNIDTGSCITLLLCRYGSGYHVSRGGGGSRAHVPGCVTSGHWAATWRHVASGDIFQEVQKMFNGSYLVKISWHVDR